MHDADEIIEEHEIVGSLPLPMECTPIFKEALEVVRGQAEEDFKLTADQYMDAIVELGLQGEATVRDVLPEEAPPLDPPEVDWEAIENGGDYLRKRSPKRKRGPKGGPSLEDGTPLPSTGEE